MKKIFSIGAIIVISLITFTACLIALNHFGVLQLNTTPMPDHLKPIIDSEEDEKKFKNRQVEEASQQPTALNDSQLAEIKEQATRLFIEAMGEEMEVDVNILDRIITANYIYGHGAPRADVLVPRLLQALNSIDAQTGIDFNLNLANSIHLIDGEPYFGPDRMTRIEVAQQDMENILATYMLPLFGNPYQDGVSFDWFAFNSSISENPEVYADYSQDFQNFLYKFDELVSLYSRMREQDSSVAISFWEIEVRDIIQGAYNIILNSDTFYITTATRHPWASIEDYFESKLRMTNYGVEFDEGNRVATLTIYSTGFQWDAQRVEEFTSWMNELYGIGARELTLRVVPQDNPQILVIYETTIKELPDF